MDETTSIPPKILVEAMDKHADTRLGVDQWLGETFDDVSDGRLLGPFPYFRWLGKRISSQR